MSALLDRKHGARTAKMLIVLYYHIPSASFCIKHEQGNTLFILKNFQVNFTIKMRLLVHCNLNG